MDYQTTAGSRDVARAAIELSMTQSRDEEQRWRQTLRQQGVIGAAADFGGDFLTGIVRIVERAVVAAKREQVIGDSHLEEGGGLLPASQQRSGGPGRRAIGPSSRTGHGCHGPPDCPEYSRGLLIRGGGTVQIDHSSTSR